MSTTRDGISLFLASGSLFHARYRVLRRLKTGGMGAVYEVVDERLDRPRALKVMHPEVVEDAELRARFELEAKATANVRSEHVVETTDAGIDAETGAPFLVMELLQGEDLEVVLQRRGPLPAEEVVAWLRQVARGLDRLHAADIVHRDLKPANIFLTRGDDGAPLVKLFDFGIARRVARTRDHAHTTRILGTPEYMSPEQIRGEGSIGLLSDLYALGHVAFALLVGQPYWSPEVREEGLWLLASKVVLGLPEPATARSEALGVMLPARFDAWFARATGVAPEERFGTATELVEALASALGLDSARSSQMTAAMPILPTWLPGGGRRSRFPRIAGALIVGAVAAIGAAGVVARSRTEAVSPPAAGPTGASASAGLAAASSTSVPSRLRPPIGEVSTSPAAPPPPGSASQVGGALERPSLPRAAPRPPPPQRPATSTSAAAPPRPPYDPADHP